MIKQRKRGKNKMKTRILAFIIVVSLALSSLCSCDLLFGKVAEQGDVTVVVENADGS